MYVAFLEWSSRFTNLLCTYSGCIIIQICSSRCSGFSWDFWTFPLEHSQFHALLKIIHFNLTDLISFNVILRFLTIRLNNFFSCFSNSSINTSRVKVVNLASLEHLLPLLCAISSAKSWKQKYKVLLSWGKVKHELRIASCELRFKIYELRVQIHELWVQIYELRVRIHELPAQIYELPIQIHKLAD